MKLKITGLAAGGFALAFLLPSQPSFGEASGTDIGNLIVWACADDSDAEDSVLEAARGYCNVSDGGQDACEVLSGSPWECRDKTQAPEEEMTCKKSERTVSISGSIPGPAGWGITGSLEGSIKYEAKLTGRKKCNTTPKDPVPESGEGGTYVYEDATMTFSVSFTITAELTLKGPGGIEIGVKGSADCTTNPLSREVHKRRTVASCGES